MIPISPAFRPAIPMAGSGPRPAEATLAEAAPMIACCRTPPRTMIGYRVRGMRAAGRAGVAALSRRRRRRRRDFKPRKYVNVTRSGPFRNASPTGNRDQVFMRRSKDELPILRAVLEKRKHGLRNSFTMELDHRLSGAIGFRHAVKLEIYEHMSVRRTIEMATKMDAARAERKTLVLRRALGSPIIKSQTG
jgi:hypothetical protein